MEIASHLPHSKVAPVFASRPSTRPVKEGGYLCLGSGRGMGLPTAALQTAHSLRST